MSASKTGSGGLPLVSVVVPARNCGALLEDCLAAIERQTYRGPMDVTVALGPSNDDTAAVLARCRLDLPLQVVDNPSGITPAALNIAVAASKGPVVARVDAQSRLPPDYIDTAVGTLADTGAANVGGVQRPVSSGGMPGAIAAAMSSPFGAGPAEFRRGGRAGPVDTVYLGVFDRAALEAVGGFDETLERNQDYELNWRLRQRGYTVWLDRDLVVDYVPRTDLAGLWRQYFAYGSWKRAMLTHHPRSLRARQLAPPALVAGLALSAAALAGRRWEGAVLPVLYAAACGASAMRLRSTVPDSRDRLRTAIAFATMHLGWGTGFLAGRTRPLRAPAGQRTPVDAR